VDEFKNELAKKTPFSKMLPYNRPKILIVTAFLASAIDGCANPMLGIFFAKMLSTLSMPLWYWEMTEGPDYVENSIKKYAMYMGLIAIMAGIGSYTQRYSFGTLGNNVTQKIRTILYANILQKNIGWFDDRDNGPSVLTSTMASDTSLINGVSTESLGP
jgi:ABC-type multidrug transport system fused ATPase/permease subunit